MGHNFTRGQLVEETKKTLALAMRKQPTESEKILSDTLRGRRLGGSKFRRQQVIRGFIVDFYCEAEGLVVEVDGPIHEMNKEYDEQRDIVLKELGLKILRVSNEDVLGCLGNVQRRIFEMLGEPHSPSG